MRRGLFGALVLLAALTVPSRASAALIGYLDVVSPGSQSYTDGVNIDVLTFSGIGDVTSGLQGVDLIVPIGITTPTSGCEAGDFASFLQGSIALLQRGGCNFSVKAANAVAAGAVGAVIFNDGLPNHVGLFGGTLESQFSIPVLSADYATGVDLYSRLLSGGVNVRLQVVDVATPVPEPASMLLLGTGLAGAGLRRWRQKRA